MLLHCETTATAKKKKKPKKAGLCLRWGVGRLAMSANERFKTSANCGAEETTSNSYCVYNV